MQPTTTRLIIFTDLDGCLLNRDDYDWSAASKTLATLRDQKISVVMNSSKTVPEMAQLAHELELACSTFISENGSVIRWGQDSGDRAESTEVIGAERSLILAMLAGLKSKFRFRSFADLGLTGVMEETQLPEAKARLALHRQGTEPLLWDDSEEQRELFQAELQTAGLTLTKGGRFWHVAGPTSKGAAMQVVVRALSADNSPTLTAAIGDSPIDQSMLDVANVPIGIPTAAGLGVSVDGGGGIVATQQGAAGWAEAVDLLLSRLNGLL